MPRHGASYSFGPGAICYAHTVASQTKTLNHHYHTAGNGWAAHAGIAIQPIDPWYRRDNPLAAHRWMHVVVGCFTNWFSPANARIWVNGNESFYWNANSPVFGSYPGGMTSGDVEMVYNIIADNS